MADKGQNVLRIPVALTLVALVCVANVGLSGACGSSSGTGGGSSANGGSSAGGNGGSGGSSTGTII